MHQIHCQNPIKVKFSWKPYTKHYRYVLSKIQTRVDSFVFLFVSRNTKLYETGHWFAEFRSFHETEKIWKFWKKCFELFREIERNVSFRSFVYLSLNYIPRLWVFYFLFEFHTICSSFAELGTCQFCRDNVIMISGHKIVCNCHFTIFILATPSRHWGLTIFWFFSGPWGYITLSRS